MTASFSCQRWRYRQHSWRHVSEGGFDRRRYEVTEVGEMAARSFVVAHHYSGSYPAAARRYALYEGPWLVGVAVLSIPVRREVLTAVFPDLVAYEETLELGRFVLDPTVPANGESWFLARCWELAARAGVRGVVSFSDPEPRLTSTGSVVFPGHVGTIYQASNAFYLGRTRRRAVLLLPDGRVLNERALTKARTGDVGNAYVERALVGFGARPRRRGEERSDWVARALVEARVRRMEHGGNHRYAFPIGSRRRLVQIGLEPMSYPKREAA